MKYESKVIWSELIAEDSIDSDVIGYLESRVELGYRTYGCMLETWNGRDSLLDLCDELADGVFYAYQARLEAEDEGDFLRAEAMFHVVQGLLSTLSILVPKLPKLPSTTSLHDD